MAPPIRGTRWRSSQPTAGPATAPSTAARITGMTIVDVWPRSQITPTITSPKPTISHDVKPSVLSHAGVDGSVLRSGTIGIRARAAAGAGDGCTHPFEPVHIQPAAARERITRRG